MKHNYIHIFLTCLNYHWTPVLNEQSCDTPGCLFKTGVTVVVNGLGPKAKFQGKNLKSKVDFYLFLSFIPIHFFLLATFLLQASPTDSIDWSNLEECKKNWADHHFNFPAKCKFFACFTGPFNRMALMHLGMLWKISLSCTSCASKSSLHKQCYTQGNLGN